MLVGVAALATGLWMLPKFRRAFFSDYQGLTFCFAGALVLGGWIGYRIFAALFH